MRHWGVNTNTSKTTENNRKLCCDCPARRLDEYGCCKGVQGPSSGVHLCVERRSDVPAGAGACTCTRNLC